jgi:hypothetical protein
MMETTGSIYARVGVLVFWRNSWVMCGVEAHLKVVSLVQEAEECKALDAKHQNSDIPPYQARSHSL